MNDLKPTTNRGCSEQLTTALTCNDDESADELLIPNRTTRLTTNLNSKHSSLTTPVGSDAVNDVMGGVALHSGLSHQALSSLDAYDIDHILTHSALAHQVLSDLVTLTRTYRKALAHTLAVKEQSDLDNYKLEQILRQTVATLEEKKASTEHSLKSREEQIEGLMNEASSQKKLAEKLYRKLKLARQHLLEAGISGGDAPSERVTMPEAFKDHEYS